MTASPLPLPGSKHHSAAPVFVILLGGTAVVLGAIAMGLSQTIIAGFLICTGVLLALVQPEAVIPCTFIYLAVLGDFRRLVSQLGGESASNDPLLLVGPAVAGMLILRALMDRSLKPDTTLSKLIAALMAVMAVQIFNPIQGGMRVGAPAALFYVVPLTWFWIGKSFATPRLTRQMVIVVLLSIACAGAVLGLYQTFFHFLPFESQWIRTSGYASLMVGQRVRPFSFFTSSAEYAIFLTTGSMVLIGMLLARRIRLIVALLPLLLLAMFLESARGPIVLTIIGTSAMFGVLGQTAPISWARFAIAPAVIGILLVTGLTHLQDVEVSERVQSLKEHQIEGFLDYQHSTAGGHAELVKDGLIVGLKQPFGQGLGATSIAAARAGTGSFSTETDFGDMFICLGLCGLLYVAVIATAISRAVIHFRQVRTLTALIILGIMVATIGQWISGAYYAAASMVCFMIGTIDRAQRDVEMAVVSAPPPRVREADAGPAAEAPRTPADRFARPRPPRTPAAGAPS